MDEARVSEWNASYRRAENHTFFPHEHVVQFINRRIRKRLGIDVFHDHIRPSNGSGLTALDFGCGIGADVLMMHEFGIDARGVDISCIAIELARQYAASRGLDLADHFSVLVPNRPLPFRDGQFDFFLSSGVLDSMPYTAARQNLLELARVTARYGFISLVSGDAAGLCGDQEVHTPHERNTIQSYFHHDRCQALVEGTGLAIRACERVVSEWIGSGQPKSGRYYMVLEKV